MEEIIAIKYKGYQELNSLDRFICLKAFKYFIPSSLIMFESKWWYGL